ncbi:MAG: hypothetical protein HY926_09305 [Elusimicrobia bacterium]|nr:hypothetical protein [Elusimicrobiota bacterium]
MNREEKKRSGLAALLMRLGIGSEAGSGAAGTGALGNLLGAGVSGGILATKAGIIGLLLVGTTVAGSLGVVAYRLFGPQASDRADSFSAQSLFSAKPPAAPGAGEDGSASANGVSKSLQFLADANTKASGEAPADASASAAPADASASAAAPAPPPLKNDNAMGSTVSKLKTDKQFGVLTKGAASGSGGSMSLAGGSAPSNASLLAGANRGNLAGLSGARAGSGGLGNLRSRSLGGGAMKQLGAVRKDNLNAKTSQAGGRTYDGNTATASQLTPADSSSTGPQDTAPDKTPGINPSGSGSNQFPEEPPSVGGTNVTPWQAAINTAMLAVMGAAALLMMASKIAAMKSVTIGMAQAIITILAVIAAALGAWVMKLGGQIGGGEYGQPLQGGLLALAGGAIIAMAATVAITALGEKDMPALQKAMDGNANLLMMVCGGVALAATAWAYLAPKKTYDSGLFKDGRPPDWDHSYEAAQVVTPPSQGILDQYLA